MDVKVMLSSGDEDEWGGAADAIVEEGSLLVLYHCPGEVSEDMKTLEIRREVEQDPVMVGTRTLPPLVKTTTYLLTAVYAPGMWMKVEFE